jgi:carbonic anhydrase/acetyltransferase-like protein (isoleucine patch superfamily)
MMAADRFAGLRQRLWLRQCASVGAGTHLRGRPSINVFDGSMTIGEQCQIASRPVVSHFVSGPGAALTIGNRVSIGHGAAIAAFDHVDIGDGTRIGPFVIIMDTNFHGRPGDQSVHHDCQRVTIGRDCIIGSRVTVTRGVAIGDGAEILAGSVVSSDIPAGACAAGARARVIGLAGRLDSRLNAAAAVLPFVVMEATGISIVPESDTALADLRGWDRASALRLVSAIRREFDVALDVALIDRGATVAGIAVAIEAARGTRTRTG